MSRYMIVDMEVSDYDELEEFAGMVDRAIDEGWRPQGGLAVVELGNGSEHYSQAMYREAEPKGDVIYRDAHTHVIYESVEPIAGEDDVVVATDIKGRKFNVPLSQLERLEDDS